MLRFDRHNSQPTAAISRKLRLKLWLLLGMLALVGLMMRHLQQPKTIENLGRLFSLQEQRDGPRSENRELAEPRVDLRTSDDLSIIGVRDGETASDSVERTAEDDDSKSPERLSGSNLGTQDGDLPALLADVQDNAVFLESETAAWLATLAEAQNHLESEIEGSSLGRVAYAQLIQQPQVYRGQVVTIHGTALREEELRPTDNQLGIDTYHRLIIAPEGGGQFPFFAYVLALPESFPRGDGIRQRVVIHGYFFKNNSYAADAGMSVAPVIVAKEVQWQPTSANTLGRAAVRTGLPPWWAIATVAAFACLIVTLLHLNTRRKKSTRKLPGAADLPELERLTDEESGR